MLNVILRRTVAQDLSLTCQDTMVNARGPAFRRRDRDVSPYVWTFGPIWQVQYAFWPVLIDCMHMHDRMVSPARRRI